MLWYWSAGQIWKGLTPSLCFFETTCPRTPGGPWSLMCWGGIAHDVMQMRLGACQKLRINLRCCRLIAAIETDEAAQSWVPKQHISSCKFMESARLPSPSWAKDRYGRFKFVPAIWLSLFLNHGDQFVLSQGDQCGCTHINTYENLCMYMVSPPC